MRTLTTLLFFIYLKIMFAVGDSNTDDIKTLIYTNITLEQAGELLAEITKPYEILPLVVLANSKKNDFDHPEDLEVVATKNRRMVKGTKFIAKNRGNQMFLCPTLNPEFPGETCFVPMEFEESQMLKCPEIEPFTMLIENVAYHPCGSGNVGKTYTVSYDVCLQGEYQNRDELIFYAVCFDQTTRTTLFTNHTIMSPKLVHSKLLLREHQIEYSMVRNEHIQPSNFKDLEYFYNNKAESLYRVQQLVPAEDMPFALWRKTTYQYFNADLQHEALFPLWNDINEYIRSYALKLYLRTQGKILIQIYTRVVEVSPGSIDYKQKSNMWVKMVFTDADLDKQGIAILMTNFIDTNKYESKSTEQSLEKFCKEDLCVSDLKKKFKDVKGHIRCCALTFEVAKLFGIEKWDYELEILHIPSINDDQVYEYFM